MRDRLKLFNVCMGSSIGSQRTMDAISTPPPHSIFLPKPGRPLAPCTSRPVRRSARKKALEGAQARSAGHRARPSTIPQRRWDRAIAIATRPFAIFFQKKESDLTGSSSRRLDGTRKTKGVFFSAATPDRIESMQAAAGEEGFIGSVVGRSVTELEIEFGILSDPD